MGTHQLTQDEMANPSKAPTAQYIRSLSASTRNRVLDHLAKFALLDSPVVRLGIELPERQKYKQINLKNAFKLYLIHSSKID